MSDPKLAPTVAEQRDSGPPVDAPQSHSTRSGQETADYSPIIQSGGDSQGSNIPDSDRLIPPDERYLVRRLLGTGGFGTVSLAYDQLIQREVAIKRPGSHLSKRDRRTFLREAQLAAKVKHPGIVIVHDVGVDSTGEPFIVYEYLEGSSLKTRLKGKPWPVSEALEMAIDIAEALEAAHREGLTHRDLKPANILLDSQGRPQISDFGLAVEESGQHHLQGQIAGTYKYMSPEQVRGDSHLLDGRTDLWSLGVILYELLTGVHPFPAPRVDEVIEQILTRDPRPPRQWQSSIPKPVEQIVLKLLSRAATDRFASAAEVGEELRGALQHLQDSSASSVRVAASENPAPRHSWLMTFSSLAAITLASSALVSVIWLSVSGSFGDKPGTVEETWPFTDADFRTDRWTPLLNPQRGPGEIYFPVGARRNWGEQGNLFVGSTTPTFLELGQTAAQNYSLELRMIPSNWLGSAGFFVGYGAIPGKADMAAATLISVTEQSSGKIALTATRIELKRGGEQFPTSLVHAPVGQHQIAVNNGETIHLLAEVRNGQIDQLYLNHVAVDAPALLPANEFPCQGKFGLFTFGGSCRFEHCRILITPAENQ